MSFEMLEVDSPAPARYLADVTEDGARMFHFKTGMLTICLYLRGISPTEKEAIRYNKILCRYHRENNFILAFLRFAGTPLIFELSFDPTIYPEPEWNARQQNIEQTNIVTILGIDTENGLLKSIRRANLPQKLWEQWKECWGAAYYTPRYSTEYGKWLKKLESKYSVMESWERAHDAGTFGETYNIPDIPDQRYRG